MAVHAFEVSGPCLHERSDGRPLRLADRARGRETLPPAVARVVATELTVGIGADGSPKLGSSCLVNSSQHRAREKRVVSASSAKGEGRQLEVVGGVAASSDYGPRSLRRGGGIWPDCIRQKPGSVTPSAPDLRVSGRVEVRSEQKEREPMFFDFFAPLLALSVLVFGGSFAIPALYNGIRDRHTLWRRQRLNMKASRRRRS